MRKGLPSYLIKKYGVSKKAWAIFRSKRTVPMKQSLRVKRKTLSRRVKYMPRRRSHRRSFPRSFKRHFRSRGGSLTMKDLAIGGAITAVIEPTLDSLLDKFIPISVAGIDPKDIGKVAIGWYLLKRRGMVKGIGATLMIVGVRNIVRGYVGSGGLSSLFATSTSTTSTGW